MPEDVTELVTQEIDRRQFLLIVASGLATLFGISRILKAFGIIKNKQQLSSKKGGFLSYSDGNYGGK